VLVKLKLGLKKHFLLQITVRDSDLYGRMHQRSNVHPTLIADQRIFKAKYLQNGEENWTKK